MEVSCPLMGSVCPRLARATSFSGRPGLTILLLVESLREESKRSSSASLFRISLWLPFSRYSNTSSCSALFFSDFSREARLSFSSVIPPMMSSSSSPIAVTPCKFRENLLSVSSLMDWSMSSSSSSSWRGVGDSCFLAFLEAALSSRSRLFLSCSTGVTLSEGSSSGSSSISWKGLASEGRYLLWCALSEWEWELLLFLLALMSATSMRTLDWSMGALFFSLVLEERRRLLSWRSKLLLLRLSSLSQVMLIQEESLFGRPPARPSTSTVSPALLTVSSFLAASFFCLALPAGGAASSFSVWMCLILCCKISTSSLSSWSSLRHLMELERRMVDLGVSLARSSCFPLEGVSSLLLEGVSSGLSKYPRSLLLSCLSCLNLSVRASRSCSMMMGCFCAVGSCVLILREERRVILSLLRKAGCWVWLQRLLRVTLGGQNCWAPGFGDGGQQYCGGGVGGAMGMQIFLRSVWRGSWKEGSLSMKLLVLFLMRMPLSMQWISACICSVCSVTALSRSFRKAPVRSLRLAAACLLRSKCSRCASISSSFPATALLSHSTASCLPRSLLPRSSCSACRNRTIPATVNSSTAMARVTIGWRLTVEWLLWSPKQTLEPHSSSGRRMGCGGMSQGE